MPKLYTYKKGIKQGYNVTLLPFPIFFFATYTSVFYFETAYCVISKLKRLMKFNFFE